jgi:hypothetical protein
MTHCSGTLSTAPDTLGRLLNPWCNPTWTSAADQEVRPTFRLMEQEIELAGSRVSVQLIVPPLLLAHAKPLDDPPTFVRDSAETWSLSLGQRSTPPPQSVPKPPLHPG